MRKVKAVGVKQSYSVDYFRDLVKADPVAYSHYEQVLGEIRDRQASIAELRKSLGLTQEDMASLLDVTQGAVSKMERSGSIETLQTLIAAMGGELHIMAAFPGEPLRELNASA